MFHLGVCDLDRGLFLSLSRFHPEQYPALPSGSTAWIVSQNRQRLATCAGAGRVLPHRLPISSRASQNAAALLFDLGTVDIR
jgi:hypothetical protein